MAENTSSVQSGAITPDDKDWTWVLDDVCPECKFDVRSFPIDTVGKLIRANAESWVPILNQDGVVARKDVSRWSILEYGCHVRDVYRLYLVRLNLMLEEDGPSYPNWDQDATAIADDYLGQVPSVVSEELMLAAGELATAFDGVTVDQWERTGFRSDGAGFTVASFARYLLHDPVHHLWDVGRD